MSTTKFLTASARFLKAQILTVEIERETEHCVWVKRSFDGKAHRQNKVSDFDIYHDTWEAAHAYLMDAADKKVRFARTRLEATNSVAENIKGMKKPEDSRQSNPTKQGEHA